MQKYIIILSLLILSACNMDKKASPMTDAPAKEEVSTNTIESATPPVNAMMSVHYTLHADAPDGKVLDTSKEEVAKDAGLYASGKIYRPLEVVLGTRSVVPGFEANISTMKKGEKKSFVVEPQDGYGEAMTTQVVSKYQVAPEFTITVDKRDLQDTVVQIVARDQLGAAGTDLKVGQTLTGGYNMVAIIQKIEGNDVTLQIENKNNPYYGKKLVVGATAEQEGANYTVKALTETGVTLDVKNSKSPFVGKKFEIGAVGSMSNPVSGATSEMKVLSLSGETVTVEMPNSHPLAGKKLYFDVEVVDIQ